MEVTINLSIVLEFISIVLAGVIYGQYLYRKGMKRGWDDAMFMLEEENIININEETGEITKVPDRQIR